MSADERTGTWDTLLFRCAICRRDVKDYPGRKGRDQQISPLCRFCESEWTRGIGKPKDGAFMDRRKAMHIIALSNALHNGAALIQWETLHARS